MAILRGEIYYVDLEPTKGSEMQKSRRPCVVVSNNAINQSSDVVIICPITGSYNKFSPIHIKVQSGEGGLTKESVVHCGQIRAIDKSRMGSKLGELNQKLMDDVNNGICNTLNL